MNDICKRCLNCGKELVQTEGKREKVYCDTTCRSNYWQKSERLEKKGLTVEQIVSAIRKSWKEVAEVKTETYLTPNSTLTDLTKDKVIKNKTDKVEKIESVKSKLTIHDMPSGLTWMQKIAWKNEHGIK